LSLFVDQGRQKSVPPAGTCPEPGQPTQPAVDDRNVDPKPADSPPTNFGNKLLRRPARVTGSRLLGRKILVSVVFVFLYIVLDRTTVYLQIWPSISAWYPPVAVGLAIVVGLGVEMLPAFLLGSYLSSFINYHQNIHEPSFWAVNGLSPLVYTAAAIFLRRRLTAERCLAGVRGVVEFLVVTMATALTVASSGAGLMVWYGIIPFSDYLAAAFNWWVGDAVAISSVTPVLLKFVLPRVKRYLQGRAPIPRAVRPPLPRHYVKQSLELAGIVISLAALFYIVFARNFARSVPLFYLFFLPVIWIAIRRGLRGIVAGLLFIDFGLALMLRLFPQDLNALAMLQFLMLILATAGLLLGAVIDESKGAELRLAEEKERIRLILETTAEGIFGMNCDGFCTFINTTGLQLLGYESRNEVLGKNFHELCHYATPDGSPLLRSDCLIHEAFEGRRGTHSDSEVFWRKDGSSFFVEYWAHPIFQSGELVGSVASFLDISERKRAEDKLRTTAQQLLSFIESAPVSVAMFNRQMVFLAASRLWTKNFGAGNENLIGMRLYDVFPHLPDEWKASHSKGMLGVRVENTEDLWPLSDGRSLWIRWALQPWRDSGGEVGGVIITAEDVTEQKHHHDELARAKQAAELASEAKSTFLATMSHEIRTPINGILGMTELTLDTELSEEQREHLGLVRFSAESLLSIINDILDFSKIEAGKLELESIPFRFRERISETVKVLKFRADQKRLKLWFTIGPGIPEYVCGDPGRIGQVLNNLVGNAIKFTERGEIAITVSAQPTQGEQIELHFEIRDTGIGVSPEKQITIFEPFSQADGSTTRKYGGTGLGLTICLKLAEMMGGRVWVQSEPGRGSTFHFTLKAGIPKPGMKDTDLNGSAAISGGAELSPSGPTAAPVELTSEPRPEGAHILLAEDNAVNRKLAIRLLEKRGFTVRVACDGREALAIHAMEDFDLILMDIQMPDLDGFGATAIIRERERATGKHVPIIALTAHALKGDEEDCRAAGMDGYITKPIRPAEMFSAIEALLPGPTPKETSPLSSPGREF
jgi:PAS domain S-box-containing protein